MGNGFVRRSPAAIGILGAVIWYSLVGCAAREPIRPEAEERQYEPGSDGPAWFEDVTDRVGLDFVHDAGPTGNYPMTQVIGSGGAFFDCDGDGLLDIYLIQNGGPGSKAVNRLFRQQPGGTFTDITEGSGLGVAGFGMGVAIGDVNNDGKPDILLTQYGGVRLFLNLGGGKFADVTEEAGLVNPLWATSAAFLDYDRDGWLDLVVVNYIDIDPGVSCTRLNGARDFCAPNSGRDTSPKLFRNAGPGTRRVSFEDVSLATGVGTVPGPGLGVLCGDFNGDGWPDIFIANDAKPNRLWINQQGRTFTEEAVPRGVAYTAAGKAFAGMGVAAGDVANDGLADLFVAHLTNETNTLWKQGPRGQFRDESAGRGLTGTRWRGTGFGTVMADFDHDGFLDIAIVNGRVTRGEPADAGAGTSFWGPYAERNQLLANRGDGRFADVSQRNPAFCATRNVGRGLAVGDFDNDGAPDLLVTTIGGRARLFRNVAPNRGHWLKVRAVDPRLNRDAYGAEVIVRAGDRRWVRWVNPAGSYLSSSSPVAHFGLGTTGQVTAIEVLWPDGLRETFPGGPPDRTIELRRGTAPAP
ncbi:CRTAC1 family protein [Fimbriiglobus ruber]|uniref:ASPIC/UnbV domain-containing protein n=1 Tax=Fimbriiglobus ruber TaxID=1908690 RepID=A0A225D365_9BACT|nr:CRTAC1 family protein [Fimbriiglobus ruber]OWK36030.1 hypothetical protein FRUB_08593 [Fimbriiglobus ruber]